MRQELLRLYKLHINSDPQGVELHTFFSSFNMGLYVKHYDPEIEKLNELGRIKDQNAAREWIYKNSKL